jgi:hypothetical protein
MTMPMPKDIPTPAEIHRDVKDLKDLHNNDLKDVQRLMREMHDQLFMISNQIGKLPFEMKESLMKAIDEKYVAKERYIVVERMVYGAATLMLVAVLSAVIYSVVK